MKTPGVYVKEVPVFPPSVAQVETAIPVFIGYTRNIADPNTGDDLTKEPIRIESFKDFEEIFGGRYTPGEITVHLDENNPVNIKAVKPDKRFFLYDAVRMFYDNGGGRCYILSVSSGKNFDYDISKTDLLDGIHKVKKIDKPTLLLFPDAVGLSDNGNPEKEDFGELQKQALLQCSKLKDRFVIMDIIDGYSAPSPSVKPIEDFRDNIGNNALKYGAAYYPWLITTYSFDLTFKMLELKKVNGGVEDLKPEDLGDEYSEMNDYQSLIDELLERKNVQEDLLSRFSFNDHSGDDHDEMIRKAGPSYLKDRLKKLVNEMTAGSFMQKNTDFMHILTAMIMTMYEKWEDEDTHSDLNSLIDSFLSDDEFVDAVIISLKAVYESIDPNNDTSDNKWIVNGVDVVANWFEDGIFTKDKWMRDTTDDENTFEKSDFEDGFEDEWDYPFEMINDKMEYINTVINAFIQLFDEALLLYERAEDDLFTNHPVFSAIKDNVTRYMRTLPPSGAIAGIYAFTDRTRGVWKAPANVSLNAVSGPAVKIDDQAQSDLNVHTTGKSINAIRAFTGKGTLVWGARTLAGNDNEWRYVSVRRLFIMAEESLRKATGAFVFESNDANTWSKVRSMSESFLTQLWRDGALQGATPDEAFFVEVGLGKTMTANDVLEGRMIVDIGLAAVRPAEFIILRFMHKMNES
jgi:uncharacterized protein